jgi:hypothetical protein
LQEVVQVVDLNSKTDRKDSSKDGANKLVPAPYRPSSQNKDSLGNELWTGLCCERLTFSEVDCNDREPYKRSIRKEGPDGSTHLQPETGHVMAQEVTERPMVS